MLKKLFKRDKKTPEPVALQPSEDKVSVLFVCMANICRSPTAQGVFTRLVEEAGLNDEIEIDSAGTISQYAGKPPDRRAQAAASERGYDLSTFRSRLVSKNDCSGFDYIIVMDETNLLDVRSICPKSCWRKIHLFMDFAPGQAGQDVPDPFAGDADDFDLVLDLAERGAAGLLAHIRENYEL